jgi:hypothetical protein
MGLPGNLFGVTGIVFGLTTAREKTALFGYAKNGRTQFVAFHQIIPNGYPNFNGEQLCSQTDPDLFYNDKPDSNVTKQLRLICAKCPKLVDCKEYAIHNERDGFWGGLTARERQGVRKRINIIIKDQQRMSAA